MQFSTVLLLLLITLNGFYPVMASTESVPQAEIKILVLGDSLSAAHNIPGDQSWPALFYQELKSQDPESTLINASISGETTDGGLQRLPDLLQKHQPTHLIVELGGNDGLRGYKFTQSQHNLQQIIDLALERNIEVLLIGVRLPPNLGPVYNQRFEKVYDSLSRNNKIEYLPHFLAGIAAGRADYMQADGIHPTELAQPLLADKVLKVFQSAWIK